MRIGGQTIEAKERSDAAQRGSPSQPRDARATSSSGDSVRLSSAGARAGAALQSSDADRSARAIRAALERRSGRRPLGVIVTDTFGRPWRQGLVNIAIGLAGVPAIVDWAGRGDAWGRTLKATMPALADELAAAAGILMQKDARTPIIVINGITWNDDPNTSAKHVLRPKTQELFL